MTVTSVVLRYPFIRTASIVLAAAFSIGVVDCFATDEPPEKPSENPHRVYQIVASEEPCIFSADPTTENWGAQVLEWVSSASVTVINHGEFQPEEDLSTEGEESKKHSVWSLNFRPMIFAGDTAGQFILTLQTYLWDREAQAVTLFACDPPLRAQGDLEFIKRIIETYQIPQVEEEKENKNVDESESNKAKQELAELSSNQFAKKITDETQLELRELNKGNLFEAVAGVDLTLKRLELWSSVFASRMEGLSNQARARNKEYNPGDTGG